MTGPRFPELGFYTLAGGAQYPCDLVDECHGVRPAELAPIVAAYPAA